MFTVFQADYSVLESGADQEYEYEYESVFFFFLEGSRDSSSEVSVFLIQSVSVLQG